METIINIAKTEKSPKQSEQVSSWQTTAIYKVAEGETALSVFAFEKPASKEEVEEIVNFSLASAFPAMPARFWATVSAELRKRGFSKNRLKHIVNSIIEKHTYPTLTIANLLNCDRAVHYLTHEEYYRRYNTTEPFDGWEKELHDGAVRYYKIIEQ